MTPSTQQELWAVDRLQVQEFMLNFLRDPLREIEEPYFFLDEVSPTLPTTLLEKQVGRPGRSSALEAVAATCCPLCQHS